MTDALTPPATEESTSNDLPGAPKIGVVIGVIEGADLIAALATVSRQSYEHVDRIIAVGALSGEFPAEVEFAEDLESAIAAVGNEIDYLWLLHSDARPRPDALAALVSEVGRNDASLGGSKLLVAGSHDVLESIGSATDIFGEPFSGLDEGEIDLQQYDVVREVAFVSSVSMLVRRDLAQGLGGLDDRLEPGAAGLDFSQRVRLAGGRVITVPSSEVYHQGRCGHGGQGWEEQAGRLGAMLKAYRFLTLIWVIPYSVIVAVIDSIANALFLRWRPLARHGASWAWNLFRIPSTIGARRRFKPVRSVGDEELFRFQARGSVHLRTVGSELTDRLLSTFDDDRALARGTQRLWASPGIWGAVFSFALTLFAARSILLSGVPNVGFSFPFEAPTVAFDRFLGGWNQADLGSAASVHPSTAFAGLTSFLWFGAEGAARTLVTLGFAVVAVAGMGRLAGRLGFRGPGRYLSGLVLLAGPGTAALTGAGSWMSLGAAALLPWAARAVFLHPIDLEKSRWVHLGLAVLFSTLVVSLSPLLAVVPLIAALIWFVFRGHGASWWLALTSISGLLLASAFLMGDLGWIVDEQRRLGLVVDDLWPIALGLMAVPVLLMENPARRLGLWGSLLGLGSIGLVKVPLGGPGVEEALLITASFGAAIVTAASLDQVSRDPRRILAAGAGLAVLIVSVGTLGEGRLGLPEGDQNDRMSFSSALAGEGGPGRILVMSAERSLLPGESRSGPGLWYRTIDGSGVTLDQLWLPEPLPGDEDLEAAIRRISTGAELRPGALLAPFAVDWVVIDGAETQLDAVLGSQLDLIPTPLAAGARVYENPSSVPLASGGTDLVWQRDGAGFAGEESDSSRVRIAYNVDSGWMPEPGEVDWAVSVGAVHGAAWYRGAGLRLLLPILAAGLFIAAVAGLIIGRFRT